MALDERVRVSLHNLDTRFDAQCSPSTPPTERSSS